MAKNLLQDMVKIKHREPVRLVEKHRHVNPPEVHERNPFEQFNEEQINTTKKNHHKLWVVAIICVMFFIFTVSYMLGKAEITINPKIQELVLKENLSATKNATEGSLPFDLVVISGEENKLVQASLEKDVSERARGKVRIFNNFSSASQRLDIDTRLEGSNGKLYKTEKAVVVPGKALNGNPGSVEVGIYAAEAGAEYNSSPLDFTIFGFKGTPKYSKFDAKSVTGGNITGGRKGKFAVVDEKEKATAVQELKATLQAKLFKKATDQIPKGFILFKEAAFLATDEGGADSAPDESGMMPVVLKGTLYGLLFNEEKLTEKIVKQNIKDYDGSPVYISHIRDLVFSMTKDDSIPFADIKNINFSLSGTAKIVWKVDTEKLTNEFLGKSKEDFNQTLLKHPNIESAGLALSPIWKRSIPDKSKDIKLVVNYPL